MFETSGRNASYIAECTASTVQNSTILIQQAHQIHSHSFSRLFEQIKCGKELEIDI